MFTEKVCRKITGLSSSIWTGWKAYDNSDIWSRLVTWKLPLFQLVVQLPRAPLGFRVETASIMHLLGDPIDSVMSMLLTLAICQSRVEEAKKTCSVSGLDPSYTEYHRTWKALAIIMVSYDECGRPEKAADVCENYLDMRRHADFEDNFRTIYDEAANSLAADRTTKILPVFFAELIFIGGWLIALIKAASSEPGPGNWPNVESHSVAMSAMYLWVTSAVVIGSVIGASQTEGSMPRLLHRFEHDMATAQGEEARRPSAGGREETEWCLAGPERALHGGVYSWRPLKWREVPRQFGVDTKELCGYAATGLVPVSACYITAVLLSYFTPPKGVSCRHVAESFILGLWMISFCVEFIAERWLKKRHLFAVVFSKDVLFATSNVVVIFMVQSGLLNRCSCWSMFGLTGVNLPQHPDVTPILMHFVKRIAPWITFMAIFFQFLFCGMVLWKYSDAIRVFVQRDDGISNLGWDRVKREDKKPEQREAMTPFALLYRSR
ncbi:hypothetical protein P154DRAFT_560345 [Amniculicola lignicola CBS 123094]|uniref:Uncharacterized protein n=1 Tax=Amniculicola lignicola CBS 123094 TaxID=1392246 RepID=A0A6A5X0L1_9PLEO|nr:hypothetical protein P154DRAFT_560345 [Amniculicola lignicola CBS 123094]